MAQDYDIPTVRLYFLRQAAGGAHLPAAARVALSHLQTPGDLEAWLAEWATADDRRRLATAIRQAKFRQRHQTRRIVIDPGTHSRLKQRARQAGVSLSKFLTQMTQEANP